MKTIEFKRVKLQGKDDDVKVPVRLILAAKTLEDLQRECAEALAQADQLAFDWREILRNHMNSAEWGRKHPLSTIDEIKLAMDVDKALNGPKKVTVDSKVADRICDIAESISWIQLSGKALSSVS